MSALRKKRLWTTADFADFLGIPHKQALAVLKALNEEVGGMLLIPTKGSNRQFKFFRSVLAKAKPEIFERVESLEERVDELADRIDTITTDQHRIVAQVGQNTRDVARLKRSQSAA